jgi:hypothetical protein
MSSTTTTTVVTTAHAMLRTRKTSMQAATNRED